MNNHGVTDTVIGGDVRWSSSLLGFRAPGRPEAAISIAVGVGAAHARLVQRVVVVVTHPANVVARVQVADDHLPVEIILRPDAPPFTEGAPMEAFINLAVVGEGGFPVAYSVSQQGAERSRELASVSGRAMEDLRCQVRVSPGGVA